jgi:carboxyl-terminal processing protease
MRGKPKTKIVLTVIRKGEDKPLEFKIVRDIIKIQSVFVKKIENYNDILYIRVASFDAKVAKGLTKAIKENKNAKGIVLDLRDNPGGLLTQAIDTVDIFVDNGVIVSQRGRDKSKEEKYYAHSSKTLTKVPLVVLVNEGSASASEIVSGALQDSKRGIIVGERTFGKGSVQVMIPINKEKDEAIKLTIARYYLPSGRTIQAKGITPDIVIHPGKVVVDKSDRLRFKESELKKHLKAEMDKDEKAKKMDKKQDLKKVDEKDEKIFISKEKLFDDNQLKSAVDILSALIITNQTN